MSSIEIHDLNNLRHAFLSGDFECVHRIVKKLSVLRFIELTFSELTEEFETYLNICAAHLFASNKEITWKSLHWYGIDSADAYAFRKRLGVVNVNGVRIISNIVDQWRVKQEQRKKETVMTIGKSSWNIPYQDIQGFRSTTMDFTDVPLPLMLEYQAYLHSWFKRGEPPLSLSRRFHHLMRITKAVNRLSNQIGSCLDLTYVDVRSIFNILQQERNSAGKKRFALKSIQSSFSEFRLLFDWLRQEKHSDSLKNPFRRFKFHNISSFVKNASYIPEDIVDQLAAAIKDCSPLVQRVWLIMMNTGARGNEVLNLEEDCLSFNEEEQIYYLKYRTSKTFKAHRKKGFDDYHYVPLLSEDVIGVIKDQINETAELRTAADTKYIFIAIANRNRITDQGKHVVRHLRTTISNAINMCIRRNNVQNENGELWHYSNHQCRKSLGVKLLTEGSSISDVGEILNHLEEKTTRQYYQDVDAMKIAVLDRQLFEQLFDSIDDEIRRAYSAEEFEKLKMEIISGIRETPEGHGSCLKHVSFGPCKKRSCVGCHMLLTGPQKLPMWKKLYHEQQTYLDNMVQSMRNEGILNYEIYRDYQAEAHLLATYSDTISKIEKFIVERDLT